MTEEEILSRLTDKNEKTACDFTGEILRESETSDRYYPLFDAFADLLNAKSSYVRTRAFALLCAQSKWDEEGKLSAAFPQMKPLLHDEKPTVVRQALKMLESVAEMRPEMRESIAAEANSIDLSRYKDSMAPLIAKDRAHLLERIAAL